MCEKPIEVQKYRLHEVACSRQNYKCKKCGEVIPKSDREQHDEDHDKPDITCDLCQEFVSKDNDSVVNHKKNECKNKPQQPIAAPISAPA